MKAKIIKIQWYFNTVSGCMSGKLTLSNAVFLVDYLYLVSLAWYVQVNHLTHSKKESASSGFF